MTKPCETTEVKHGGLVAESEKGALTRSTRFYHGGQHGACQYRRTRVRRSFAVPGLKAPRPSRRTRRRSILVHPYVHPGPVKRDKQVHSETTMRKFRKE